MHILAVSSGLTDCEREGKVQKSPSKLCYEENSAVKGEGERWDDACKLNAVFDLEELELIWILAEVSSKLDFNYAVKKRLSRFTAGFRTLRIQFKLLHSFIKDNCQRY